MKPETSVVIATRDRPLMLREAIASVRAQESAGPVEVIVVYDHSDPDLSLAVTEADFSVRVVDNVRRPGLAGARNTGITLSEAEFVAFCDDDDYWLPGKLTAQLAALREHPDAVLATCGICVEYDDEQHPRSLDRLEVTLADLARDRLAELHPSTFVFRRRRLVDDVGLVDEEVPGGFGEDYELLLRTAKVAAIRNVPAVGTRVRWGGNSFFFQRWQMMADGLRYVVSQHPEIRRDRRGLARIEGQIAFAEASRGQRRLAGRHLRAGLLANPLEPRLPLAALVATPLVKPAFVMRTLHRFGRGI